MALLQIRDLFKEYGVQTVLDGISELIEDKDKIGLVGTNGAGKSTLLKILAGIISPDGGELTWIKGCRVGYLKQQEEFSKKTELFSEVLSVFEELLDLRAQIGVLEKEISLKEVFSVPDRLARRMEEYERLTEQYKQANGYSCESRVRGVLRGLGFKEEQFEQQIKEMSGGQQRRVLLAKILVADSELLLLDEPTNHLDIEAIEWLEGYLKDFPGAAIIISHDRYFLNNITNKIWDLEQGKIKSYLGNYEQYIRKKEQRINALLKEYEKQEFKIASLEQYIRKNQAGVNAKQARGRKKILDKMRTINKPVLRKKQIGLMFTTKGGTGNIVCELIDVSIDYNDRIIFKNLNLLIRNRERIGLVGPNGVGKTTLCKIISGDLSPDSGQSLLGHRVKIGYYSQTLEQLPTHKSIIDFIREEKPLSEEEARNYLGRFLFSNDDVFKTIDCLSGGEQSRVALAHLMLGEANFLILDEPTNHLDIQAQETLKTALNHFDGTLIIVSHNRYFLDQIAEKIIELKDGKLTTYLGNYTYYRQKKNEYEQLLKEKQAQEKKKILKTKTIPKEKKESMPSFNEVEDEIIILEQKLAQLTELLANPNTYSEQEKVKLINQEYNEVNRRLLSLYEVWEQLV